MTRMYNQGMPENIIVDKSGHRSIGKGCAKGVWTPIHEKAAGNIIANPIKCFKEYQIASKIWSLSLSKNHFILCQGFQEM